MWQNYGIYETEVGFSDMGKGAGPKQTPMKGGFYAAIRAFTGSSGGNQRRNRPGTCSLRSFGAAVVAYAENPRIKQESSCRLALLGLTLPAHFQIHPRFCPD